MIVSSGMDGQSAYFTELFSWSLINFNAWETWLSNIKYAETFSAIFSIIEELYEEYRKQKIILNLESSI